MMDDVIPSELTLEGTEGTRPLRASPGHRLLLIFYREDNTPTCTTQVTSFKEDFALLSELDAEVAAVSVDPIVSHRCFAERLGGIPFALLTDPEGVAARAFGVWDEQNHRAMRAVFVIDDQGKVLHTARNYNPANLSEYEQIFHALGLEV